MRLLLTVCLKTDNWDRCHINKRINGLFFYSEDKDKKIMILYITIVIPLMYSKTGNFIFTKFLSGHN